MSIIYEPSGKAKEYSELAVNLYTGCSHKCLYCYCPSIMRTTMQTWSALPHPRTNVIKLLEKDAEKLYGTDKEVLFSFMTDPYQSDEAAFLTRNALLILERNAFQNVTILTKAGFRAVKDFDILQRNNWKFAQTIIMQNEDVRAHWEPGASSIASRYIAVKLAKEQGIKTWVSVEPVVDAVEALKVIYDLKQYVDHWKIGKLNHMPAIEKNIDWHKFYHDVVKELNGYSYYIKK